MVDSSPTILIVSKIINITTWINYISGKGIEERKRQEGRKGRRTAEERREEEMVGCWMKDEKSKV